MSGIRHLCDHRGIIYRATVLRDELQDTVEVWAPLRAPSGKNCRPNQNWGGALQDFGPGEQQAATRQWFLERGFDVAERDVLAVVDGPEAPVNLRVLSVAEPANPFLRHHLEVVVELWPGTLTEPAGES